MRKIIEDFPAQWQEAWEMGSKLAWDIPEQVENVVVAGMGGSAIGGDLLNALARDRWAIPVWVNRDYDLPAWVNNKTLFIAVSYSGNTEETLTALKKAKEKEAIVWGISSGGELEKEIEGKGNFLKLPGGYPPRGALGFLLAPLLALFNRQGFLDIEDEEIREAQKILKEIKEENARPEEETPAGLFARQLAGKLPLIYGAPPLGEASAYRWKCQINENSKAPAFSAFYPELNHNEIVGWEEPKSLVSRLVVIHLEDHKAFPRNNLRMDITADLLKSKGVPVAAVSARGEYPLGRLLSLIYFGDYVSWYLARIYEQEPEPVHIIEDLKTRLKKENF